MSLSLRPLAAADTERVLAWRNSPTVSQWMYGDRAIGEAEHAGWMRSVLVARASPAPDRLYWVAELDQTPVGVANLARIDRANGRCDWAYYLADPAVRGRGVGAAVEYAVLRHVFDVLQLNKLCCEVLAENAAVIALHEGFGFQREALLRAHVRKAGQWRDVVGLGLLASDWAQIEPECRARIETRGWDLGALSLT
jgi:UDP-4-amino-4,6-dideoxy-N-acetyl-beta-L-altrosamine N-acetyltransferase